MGRYSMQENYNKGELLDNFLEFSDATSVFRILSRAEYILLGKIIKMGKENSGKVYLEDLKKELNVPMSTVSEIVRNLNDDGLIIWELDAENKKTYVEIVANGLDKYNLQREGMKKISARIDEEMDDNEKEVIINVIKRIGNIMREESGRAEAYFKLIRGEIDRDVNVMSLIKQKSTVTYANEKDTLDDVLVIFKKSGYTTIPVVSEDGKYAGTVSEGDLLWYIRDNGLNSIDTTYVGNIINIDRNPPVNDIADAKTIIHDIMSQNFLSMVDDRGCFIGIITRKDVIRYLRKKTEHK